jgi:hypothetical protein
MIDVDIMVSGFAVPLLQRSFFGASWGYLQAAATRYRVPESTHY